MDEMGWIATGGFKIRRIFQRSNNATVIGRKEDRDGRQGLEIKIKLYDSSQRYSEYFDIMFLNIECIIKDNFFLLFQKKQWGKFSRSVYYRRENIMDAYKLLCVKKKSSKQRNL